MRGSVVCACEFVVHDYLECCLTVFNRAGQYMPLPEIENERLARS